MCPKLANPAELRLLELCRNRHGVVSRRQLLRLGFKERVIGYRASSGRLHRVHRGVYALGPPPALSDHGHWMAAVLALGPEAVLSHRSAAALWGLLSLPSRFSVEVTLPGNGGRARRRGIRVHRSRTLEERDANRRHNIPVTTPTRTLLDLKSCAAADQLAQARREAGFHRLSLDLKRLDPPDPTRSELEQRFLRLCRRHRLPTPEVNVLVEGFEVDFLWREQRLVVETDGWDAHRGREAFEADRRRDTALATAGYDVMRVSWRQVMDEPRVVARAVRGKLRPTPASARPA